MPMEPETKDFLRRVLLSVLLGFIWLCVNMTLGIYYDLLPIYDKPDVWNILFYCFFLGTGVLYGIFLFRTWKKKFPHG
jgi:peptidoglycan/LPS O-acetylase OafA/YrhL